MLTDNGVQFITPGNVASAAKDIREARDLGFGRRLISGLKDRRRALHRGAPWTKPVRLAQPIAILWPTKGASVRHKGRLRVIIPRSSTGLGR
jgi:hypothetical protein